MTEVAPALVAALLILGSILDSLGYLYVVQHAGLPVMAGTDVAPGESFTDVPAGFTLHQLLAEIQAKAKQRP